jgi:hypothetical protein
MLESRANGILFLGIFGGLWLFLAASGLPSPYPIVADVVALAVVAAIFVASMGLRKAARLQLEPTPAELADRTRADKWFYWSLGGEGVALFLIANLLLNLHLGVYLWPAISLIVGLHFYPLSYGLRLRIYTGTATLMSLAAILVMIGIKSGHTPAMGWDSAVCYASAVVLWGTCALIVRQARQRLAETQ